jgi:hypothetical protein
MDFSIYIPGSPRACALRTHCSGLPQKRLRMSWMCTICGDETTSSYTDCMHKRGSIKQTRRPESKHTRLDLPNVCEIVEYIKIF